MNAHTMPTLPAVADVRARWLAQRAIFVSAQGRALDVAGDMATGFVASALVLEGYRSLQLATWRESFEAACRLVSNLCVGDFAEGSEVQS